MTREEQIDRFGDLCAGISRPGINDLLEWLHSSDFFTAPSSRQFHGAKPGGLLEHSLNVYDELKRLLSAYPEITATEETAVIISLFHDLCKVNFYTTEKRNRKGTDGKWETYDAYAIKEKFCFGGHGSKSVFLLQNFIKLTPEEAAAINCHMGAYEDPDGKYVSKTYEQFPIAWLLHVADEAAAFIVESDRN